MHKKIPQTSRPLQKTTRKTRTKNTKPNKHPQIIKQYKNKRKYKANSTNTQKTTRKLKTVQNRCIKSNTATKNQQTSAQKKNEINKNQHKSKNKKIKQINTS